MTQFFFTSVCLFLSSSSFASIFTAKITKLHKNHKKVHASSVQLVYCAWLALLSFEHIDERHGGVVLLLPPQHLCTAMVGSVQWEAHYSKKIHKNHKKVLAGMWSLSLLTTSGQRTIHISSIFWDALL